MIWASTIEGKFPETAGTGSRDYNHRLYAIHTRDYVTFTQAKLFYDPGFQVIDGAVFRDASRYAMIAKNETEKPAPGLPAFDQRPSSLPAKARFQARSGPRVPPQSALVSIGTSILTAIAITPGV